MPAHEIPHGASATDLVIEVFDNWSASPEASLDATTICLAAVTEGSAEALPGTVA